MNNLPKYWAEYHLGKRTGVYELIMYDLDTHFYYFKKYKEDYVRICKKDHELNSAYFRPFILNGGKGKSNAAAA